MGILSLVGNDTSYVVLSCFVANLDSFVFPAFRGGGHFEYEPKTGFAIGGFGGLFYLDIWYPKEHISRGMALITFVSNLSVS